MRPADDNPSRGVDPAPGSINEPLDLFQRTVFAVTIVGAIALIVADAVGVARAVLDPATWALIGLLAGTLVVTTARQAFELVRRARSLKRSGSE